jgi:Uma2 family endonuclease
MISATIARILGNYAVSRHQGVVFGEAGFVLRRGPDTLRAPDAAFIRADRIPPTGPPKTFWETAPDLIVEVVSPNDTAAEVQSKVRDWIEAGVRLAWVVYPSACRVVVVHSLQEREELDAEDTLSGGEVLPGFSCPVNEIFEW